MSDQIKVLEDEIAKWKARTFAALTLIPPDVMVGDLRTVEHELRAERDVLKARLARYESEKDPYAPHNKQQLDDMADHINTLSSRNAELEAEVGRLRPLVESAYVEGWQDAHTQKATHGPVSVTTPWEVSNTRAALSTGGDRD